MIRSDPLSLMANYSKIKRVEPLQGHTTMAVKGNQNPEEQEDIEEVEEKTREAKKRGSRKAR